MNKILELNIVCYDEIITDDKVTFVPNPNVPKRQIKLKLPDIQLNEADWLGKDMIRMGTISMCEKMIAELEKD